MLIQSEIAKSFAKAATHYDQHAILQQEVGRRLVERLDYIRLIPERILDLGAGTGLITQLLKKRYRHSQIVAIDHAHAMLRQAYQKDSWWSRQHYCCANAHFLPLADNSMDLIVSNLMLHWCNEIPQVLREVHRVLRPNGMFMFATLGPMTLHELRNSWAQVDLKMHVNEFGDMHDLGDALLRASFADPVVDMETIILNYQRVIDLMRDLKGIGAHNMNSERPNSFIGKSHFQQVLAAYEQYRQPNGKLPASYEVIYGHAWKVQTTKTSFVNAQGEVVVPLNKIGLRGK